MSQKQWQQPEIIEINIKNTESGTFHFFGEGTWISDIDPTFQIDTCS